MTKVFILAAGLGTRLKHLTTDKPKALVSLNGTPILEQLILNLKMQGFNNFVINVHHFADLIENFLSENNNFGCNIEISDERKELLDTGGALLRAKTFLKNTKNILLHNADIISDMNLHELIKYHNNQNALATLAVQKRQSVRKLIFDDKNMLCEWKNLKTGEQRIARKTISLKKEYAFTGIHIVNRKIFDYITEKGKFSIIDLYLRLAENQIISAYEIKPEYWFDLGKPETLLKAEMYLKNSQT